MAEAHAKSAISFAKLRVAAEMTRKTQYSVTGDMVMFIRGNAGSGVFVAHIDDSKTVLCKVMGPGKLSVKVISW